MCSKKSEYPPPVPGNVIELRVFDAYLYKLCVGRGFPPERAVRYGRVALLLCKETKTWSMSTAYFNDIAVSVKVQSR